MEDYLEKDYSLFYIYIEYIYRIYIEYILYISIIFKPDKCLWYNNNKKKKKKRKRRVCQLSKTNYKKIKYHFDRMKIYYVQNDIR